MLRITHEPSGDEAEAVGKPAAIVAARTLLEDNGFEGTCRIWQGELVIDVVWADNPQTYMHTTISGGS